MHSCNPKGGRRIPGARQSGIAARVVSPRFRACPSNKVENEESQHSSSALTSDLHTHALTCDCIHRYTLKEGGSQEGREPEDSVNMKDLAPATKNLQKKTSLPEVPELSLAGGSCFIEGLHFLSAEMSGVLAPCSCCCQLCHGFPCCVYSNHVSK